MTKRLIVNTLALAVVFGGSLSLSAQRSATTIGSVEPAKGGTCCDASAKTCYLNLGDGIVVTQTNSYAC
ncbi:hypothetical protein [Longimicrobium sp.]|uniref:hypothetical protein n=1 Tax=Longimicrobium sp. TaxID=2029185 RepID=UPI002E318313|nr:hypothetical protein [Longimicrobium sp.]HEX6040586.1 hypothetical protein [Longimicrobium sp.]